MNADALRQAIAGGEGVCLEFKRELSSTQARDICKEVAALASTAGGHVLLGVDDDGTVVGLADPHAEERRVSDMIHRYVFPVPLVSCDVVGLDGRRVLVIGVEKSAAPISYYDQRPMLRVGSVSRQAAPAEVENRHFGLHTQIREVRDAIAALPAPSRVTAPAIVGQGELATWSYAMLRSRLIEDFPALGVE